MKSKSRYLGAHQWPKPDTLVHTCDPSTQHAEVKLQSVLQKLEYLKIGGMKEEMGKREKKKRKRRKISESNMEMFKFIS